MHVHQRFITRLPGEKLFGVDESKYERTLVECNHCGHFDNWHSFSELLSSCYENGYREGAYGKQLEKRFNEINNLPRRLSSNAQRIENLHQLLIQVESICPPGCVLDIGSGTAVFGAGMKARGWSVTALDVDPISTAHARDYAGLRVYTGEFINISLLESYDLICFNKVLEHVPSTVAIAMLKKATNFLKENAFLYLEVPDGEEAIRVGANRQEFFFEHFGAFSLASFQLLLKAGGLESIMVERLEEVGGKFTIRALAQKVKK